MSHTIATFLVFVLVAAGMLCALLAFTYPRVRKDYPMNRRIELTASTGNVGAAQRASDAARRRSVEETLRENEERAAKAKTAKPSLTARLRQAQLSWSKN